VADERRAKFRALHESGCFVIPNPWDVGTARFLATLSFRALATTSAGVAFSDGLPDEPLPPSADQSAARARILAHIGEIVRATDLPVNADYQSGYARDAEGVVESVRLCVETGVAGLSIEDATGEAERPLFETKEAVERIKAARLAIGDSGVLLTARAECFLVGHDDPLRESIKRLQAYAEAGADVLYAPGLPTREHIAAVVQAVAPKPVNVLMSASIGLTAADLADLGVRRISVGSALSRVAWGAFVKASREIASYGTFTALADAIPFPEINSFFSVDY
jgi:2-methylisocitrate lyase-like PEP mutase family enzyme